MYLHQWNVSQPIVHELIHASSQIPAYTTSLLYYIYFATARRNYNLLESYFYLYSSSQ
jgi:hypothetical protein